MQERTGYELIDLDVALDVMSDGGLEAGLIELFLQRTEARLAALSDALAAGDSSGCGAIAHSLKGSCATYGATRLAERAALVDTLAREGLLAKARVELPVLRQLLPATRAELERAAAALTAGEAD